MMIAARWRWRGRTEDGLVGASFDADALGRRFDEEVTHQLDGRVGAVLIGGVRRRRCHFERQSERPRE